MKRKNTSRFMKYSFISVLILFSLIISSNNIGFLSAFISTKKLVLLYGIALFACFFFTASMVLSSLALSAHKGQTLSTLMFSYKWFYFFLTDEARKDWRDFISTMRLPPK